MTHLRTVSDKGKMQTPEVLVLSSVSYSLCNTSSLLSPISKITFLSPSSFISLQICDLPPLCFLYIHVLFPLTLDSILLLPVILFPLPSPYSSWLTSTLTLSPMAELRDAFLLLLLLLTFNSGSSPCHIDGTYAFIVEGTGTKIGTLSQGSSNSFL